MAKRVVLDPGHGGNDPGAIGFGYKESNITLSIAKQVRDILKNNGVEIKMTRESDIDVSLGGRCTIEKNFGADCFVSIHCNAFNTQAKGLEVYTYKNAGNSYRLGQAVYNNIKNAGLYTVERGIKGSPVWYVVKNTNSPAILIETAFIDNTEDIELLKNRQADFARAIARGILEYLGLNYVESKPQAPKVEAPQEVKKYGVVTAKGGLNVRDGRGTSYLILGTLPYNSKVRLGAKVGNWWNIYFSDHGGWVCADYIREV